MSVCIYINKCSPQLDYCFIFYFCSFLWEGCLKAVKCNSKSHLQLYPISTHVKSSPELLWKGSNDLKGMCGRGCLNWHLTVEWNTWPKLMVDMNFEIQVSCRDELMVAGPNKTVSDQKETFCPTGDKKKDWSQHISQLRMRNKKQRYHQENNLYLRLLRRMETVIYQSKGKE